MIAASMVFHEHLPLGVWAGGLLITAGVAVLGNGETKPGV
jgi:drug/metabolite transporter (DMT)-like permease